MASIPPFHLYALYGRYGGPIVAVRYRTVQYSTYCASQYCTRRKSILQYSTVILYSRSGYGRSANVSRKYGGASPYDAFERVAKVYASQSILHYGIVQYECVAKVYYSILRTRRLTITY